MNNTTLKQIPIVTIKKFWAILGRLDRHTSEYYTNGKCQKEVFCSRVSALLPKGYMVLNYPRESTQGFTFYDKNGHVKKIRSNEIFYFSGFRYNLGYSDKIILNNEKMSFNDLLDIQYRWMSANEIMVYTDIIGSPIYKEKVYKVEKNVTVKKIQCFFDNYSIKNSDAKTIKLIADHRNDSLFLSAKDSDRYNRGDIVDLPEYEIEIIQTIK